MKVEFESESDVKTAFESLVQETEFKKKSEVKLEKNGRELAVKITAEDLATLRASVNSYLRLLNVVKSVKKICSG
ncbi:hypothetical protein HY992_03625 [Candidatus Micrarchaeota archaeon]|nr:hypothetical protein [Candidatus Micrarchaeota archaeon]